MKLIEDRKQLDTLIVSIKGRGAKLDNDIQLAGLSVLNHANVHGDVTLVNRLYNALGQGARKAALSGWLIAYGSLAANTDKDTKKEMPFRLDRTKTTDLTEAAANAWFTFAPDKAPDEVFDVSKALAALLKRAEKATSVREDDAPLLAALVRIRAEVSGVAVAGEVDGNPDGEDGEE